MFFVDPVERANSTPGAYSLTLRRATSGSGAYLSLRLTEEDPMLPWGRDSSSNFCRNEAALQTGGPCSSPTRSKSHPRTRGGFEWLNRIPRGPPADSGRALSSSTFPAGGPARTPGVSFLIRVSVPTPGPGDFFSFAPRREPLHLFLNTPSVPSGIPRGPGLLRLWEAISGPGAGLRLSGGHSGPGGLELSTSRDATLPNRGLELLDLFGRHPSEPGA